MTSRVRLDLSYDGAAFHGWAVQSGTDLRTAQGELQDWLARILGRPAELTCAGRTDAGVHARGQVAHLDVADDEDAADVAAHLARRLPRALPPDLVVRAVTVAPPGFDARFAALWRRYVYRLTDAPAPDPLLRGHVVRVGGTLDVEAMDAAGAALLGLHDFGAFCKRREGASTIRTLLDCTSRRTQQAREEVVEVEVRADAFCHSMVRSLVGALVDVGLGRRPADWASSLLDRSERAGDVTVMPPQGLVLEEVGYPSDAGLAARVLQSRTRREPCEATPTQPEEAE